MDSRYNPPGGGGGVEIELIFALRGAVFPVKAILTFN